MKGYVIETPKPPQTPQKYNVYVGCTYCDNSWYESRFGILPTVSINSAMRIYNACDNCYDPEKGERKLPPKYGCLSVNLQDFIKEDKE